MCTPCCWPTNVGKERLRHLHHCLKLPSYSAVCFRLTISWYCQSLLFWWLCLERLKYWHSNNIMRVRWLSDPIALFVSTWCFNPEALNFLWTIFLQTILMLLLTAALHGLSMWFTWTTQGQNILKTYVLKALRSWSSFNIILTCHNF